MLRVFIYYASKLFTDMGIFITAVLLYEACVLDVWNFIKVLKTSKQNYERKWHFRGGVSNT